jgi:hypothetical protein
VRLPFAVQEPMPDYTPSAESEQIPMTGQDVRELYEELRGLFSARNAVYADAGKLYRGEHWDGEKLVAERGRYSLTANYIGTTVDKGVEGLVGIMPSIQVIPQSADQPDRTLAEKAEAVLYGTWAHNRMDRVLRRVAHNQITKAKGWIYLWWDEGQKKVRYRSLPPENVYPVYDGDDLVEAIVVSLRPTRELMRKYPALKTQIATTTQTAETDEVIVDDPARLGGNDKTAMTKVIDWFDADGNWVRVMGDAVHRQKLGYGTGRVPLYQFDNKLTGDETEPKGDIDDIAELNRYYDQLLSQQADIIRKYANPPILDEMSGQSAVDIQRAVRADGGVIPLKKGGMIRYLNWDGTMPEIGAQLDRVKGAIHDLSGKPPSAYGETVTNQSGVVTNLALTPTVAQTTTRETLMGATLQELNADTLRLYEKFAANDEITFQGMRRGRTPYQSKPFKVALKGSEIAGWYENRIKWPSAYRIDDPVYVQNKLQLAQSDPPFLSAYDLLEELGYDDVEGRIDRIQTQLEDPRFHPERMKQAIDSALALGSGSLPTDLEGFAGGGGGLNSEDVNDAAEATGSPDRSALVQGTA